jgi:hypothetical protein
MERNVSTYFMESNKFPMSQKDNVMTGIITFLRSRREAPNSGAH